MDKNNQTSQASGGGLEGQSKILEYAERIRGGASREDVLQGLPKSWTEAVDKELEKDKESPKTQEEIVEIPPELTDEMIARGSEYEKKLEREREERKRKAEEGISSKIEVPKKEVRKGDFEIAAEKRDQERKEAEKKKQQQVKEQRVEELRRELRASSQEEDLDMQEKSVRDIKGIMAMLTEAAGSIGENAHEKVREYVARIIQNPDRKEEILQNLGPTFRGSVEELLSSVEQNQKTENIELGIEKKNTLETIQGFESIEKLFKELGNDYHFFTHITDPTEAQKIYNGKFQYPLGTGLSSTMTLLGKDGVLEQIGKIISGNSPHRGYEGMFIIAVPKNVLPAGERFTSEAFSDYLVENYAYPNGQPNPEYMDSANIKIPPEFNLGYLNKDMLTYNSSFIKKNP